MFSASIAGKVLTYLKFRVPLYDKTETLPSEDAHVSIGPSSWGAQETEFTAKEKLDDIANADDVYS